MNVPHGQELSHRVSTSGIAQDAVPGLEIAPAVLLHVGPCNVLASYDQWHNGFYVAIQGRRSVIEIEGTSPVPEHGAMLKARPPREEPLAGWILDHWSSNYFHWVVYCLPKAVAMAGAGLADRFLLPARSPLMAVIEDSVAALGCNVAAAPRLEPGPNSFADLVVVQGGRFGPALLQRTREAFVSAFRVSVEPGRRLLLSREGAKWRVLINEKELIRLLDPMGFEVVHLERMSFRQQVELFASAGVVIAPHGAGLANMVWSPAGCKVIEISSSRELNPDYYRLALAMGHDYWIVEASLEGDRKPAYRDLRVSVAAVSEAVAHALS